MKRKTNLFFTGVDIVFESFSNTLSLTQSEIKRTSYSDDARVLKNDWKNIGRDLQEAIDDFSSK